MRVLYVQPGPGVGGSKISLRTMLKNAPSDQVSQIVLSKPSDPDFELSLSGKVEKFHDLDLPTWQRYRRMGWLEKLKEPLSHVWRLLCLFPAVSKLVRIIKEENIELIHTNNSICPAGAFAAYLAGVPHVWHVREPIGSDGQYPLIVGDWLAALLFRDLSDIIVCNSLYTSAFFQKRNISVRVITNGVDIRSFQTPDARERGHCLRQSLAGDDAKPMVAMIGNLTTRWKQHGLFLEVVARLRELFPGCSFVVFGGSSDLGLTPYTNQLGRTLEQLGIKECIIWADFVDDVPAMMHSMDILVHPASTEGSGRVVMEAMAAGKAVVGSRSGGVQELIEDGVTGFLVPPGDVEALTNKVHFLLENPRERTSMGYRALEFAHQNFSDQAMMNAITAIYNEIMQERA